MNGKFYMFVCGGLGDCFRALNNPDSVQTYFTHFLKKYPSADFTIAALCKTPIQELFRDITCVNFADDESGLKNFLTDKQVFSDFLHKTVEQCRPFYNPYNPILNFDEQKILQKLIHKKYFILHPFAGDEGKTPRVDWEKITCIIRSFGFDVVILGGTHRRFGRECVTEKIKIRHSFNLLDCGLPLSYAACCNAQGVVGADSCWWNLGYYRTSFVFVILNASFVAYDKLAIRKKINSYLYHEEIFPFNNHLRILDQRQHRHFCFDIENVHKILKNRLDWWIQ